MLSICIPIYNFDVNPLVTDLLTQMELLDISSELILIDDCSNEKFKKINASICKKARYIKLEQNIGRAKIRNLFLEYITFENLLFLDCDSYIRSEKFLENYVKSIINSDYSVIFGGRVYEEKCESRTKRLSWKYGTFRESKNAIERMKNPNKSFMTNNFLIKKDILQKIKFNERLIKYGHEDTLFGIELLKNKIEIKHIENPVLNGDVETNTVYLRKTEEGIKNLIFIQQKIDFTREFTENVNLLYFYEKLKDKNQIWLFKSLFFLLKHPIRFILKNGLVSLRVFDFYKLGYYIQNKN